jgi:hypothetical protein
LSSGEIEGRRRRYATAAVGVVVAFAAWSRWPLLREGLWADESLTVFLARSRSPAEFLARLRVADYSPPLFDLLLAGWGRLFGFGELAVKALPFTLGLIGVGTAAMAAAELFGGAAAVLAAVLVANNRLMIEMSAELRSYALSAALAGLALFYVFRIRSRIRAKRDPAVATIAATAALVLFGYSHYAGMLAVAILGIAAMAALALRKEKAFWNRVAASAAIAGAAFLPWLPIFNYQRRIGLPWAPPLTAALQWPRFGTRIRDFLPIVSDGAGAGSWIGVAILILALIASKTARQQVRTRAAALALCGALAAVCFFFVAWIAPASRYLSLGVVFSVLFAAGLLSAAVWRSVRRGSLLSWTGFALVVAGAFVGISWKYDQIRHDGRVGLGKSGIRTAFEKNRFGPTDILIAVPDVLSQSLGFYSKGFSPIRGFPRWNDPLIPDYENYSRDWTDPSAIENAWEALTEDVRRLDAKRIVLFAWPGEAALSSGCARDFVDFLHQKLRVLKEQSYTGTIENADVTIFVAPTARN